MRDTVEPPEVAVILTAHDRRRYLGRALDSLMHQTLPAGRFETVVVTNFHDPQIESRCAAMGAMTIVTDATPQGAKVLAGLQMTTAPLISILEDDDAYYPMRLSNTVDTFRTHPDVGYVHNNWKYFKDEEGLRLDDSERTGDLVPIRIRGMGPSPRSTILRRMKTPYFNSSSVSLRRRIIEPHLPELADVNYILDVFLFFVALASSEDMLFSPQILTGVGIGSGNISLGGGQPGPARRFALRRYSESILPNYSRLEDVARSSSDPDDLKLAMAAALVQRTMGYLRGLTTSNRQLFECAVELVESSRSLFVRENWPVVPLSLLGSLWPSAMRLAYRALSEVAAGHTHQGFIQANPKDRSAR